MPISRPPLARRLAKRKIQVFKIGKHDVQKQEYFSMSGEMVFSVARSSNGSRIPCIPSQHSHSPCASLHRCLCLCHGCVTPRRSRVVIVAIDTHAPSALHSQATAHCGCDRLLTRPRCLLLTSFVSIRMLCGIQLPALVVAPRTRSVHTGQACRAALSG